MARNIAGTIRVPRGTSIFTGMRSISSSTWERRTERERLRDHRGEPPERRNLELLGQAAQRLLPAPDPYLPAQHGLRERR